MLMLKGHSQPLMLAAPPDAIKTPRAAGAASAVSAVAPPPATAQPEAPSAGKAPKAPIVTWTVRSGATEEPAAKRSPARSAAVSTENATQAVGSPTPPASRQAPTSQAPAVSSSKLTPYAPARWDESGEPIRSTVVWQPKPTPAVVPPQLVIEPAQAVTGPGQQRTRTAHAVAAAHKSGLKLLPAVVIGSLAGGALLVAGLLIFKPAVTTAPSSNPVAVQPAVITPVLQRHAAPVVRRAMHTAKPVIAPTQHSTTTPAVKAVATPKPAAAPASVRPKPAAQRVVATRPTPPKPISHYARLYQPESGPVVALGSVEAYYGPRGRAVRVLWGAAEQASASVQLIDQHGMTVSATSVRGARSSALLYLPRGFHGPLTVQVSSFGRMGERVATTTSLPTFGQ
jgi:hypothetical protein